MESNFTPRYQWLDTVDNGWPESEYLCGLGLVLFVIGRWTHLDTLNSICLTVFGVGLGQFGEFRGRFWKKFYDIILSSEKRRIEDLMSSCSSSN